MDKQVKNLFLDDFLEPRCHGQFGYCDDWTVVRTYDEAEALVIKWIEEGAPIGKISLDNDLKTPGKTGLMFLEWLLEILKRQLTKPDSTLKLDETFSISAHTGNMNAKAEMYGMIDDFKFWRQQKGV